MQKITLIAALARNRVIGNANQIPWHIPEDFAFFKQYTTGKPIIMGRKTWDSLPRKPLPNRRNLVITRQNNWQADSAETFANIQAALNACADAPEIIIIGGAQIYAQCLQAGWATDLRLTEIALDASGDAFFPELPPNQWREISRDPNTSQNGIHFDLVHYQHIKPEN